MQRATGVHEALPRPDQRAAHDLIVEVDAEGGQVELQRTAQLQTRAELGGPAHLGVHLDEPLARHRVQHVGRSGRVRSWQRRTSEPTTW